MFACAYNLEKILHFSTRSATSSDLRVEPSPANSDLEELGDNPMSSPGP